jgi:hypothetical protein
MIEIPRDAPGSVACGRSEPAEMSDMVKVLEVWEGEQAAE